MVPLRSVLGSLVGPALASARAVRGRALRVDPREVGFERRGFARTDPARVARLERVAAHFVRGYDLAIRDPGERALEDGLEAIEPELRGFGYEGAGMALEVLDLLSPWRRDRLPHFVAGAGARHTYMVQIGAGWAWARLGPLLARPERRLARLDPVLGWLALDGYGFHEGFFAPAKTVVAGRRPRPMRGALASAFDSGVGRSLWFVCGAEPAAIAGAIEALGAERRADLWAGCGLASAYAGGVPAAVLRDLATRSGRHRAALAQGAAFAAKARERAGNAAAHTELAVSLFCGLSAEEAARRCDGALADAQRETRDAAQPLFHAWRLRLQRELAGRTSAPAGDTGVRRRAS